MERKCSKKGIGSIELFVFYKCVRVCARTRVRVRVRVCLCVCVFGGGGAGETCGETGREDKMQSVQHRLCQ